MKTAIIVAACLIVSAHAGLLHDLLSPITAFNKGVLQTVTQVLPYSLMLGKQLLKDTTSTVLKGVGQEITALVSAPVKLLFGKRDLSLLHTLMSNVEHITSKIHQFEELLEHEFNNVAAGGHVGSAVQRLDDLLGKVHGAVQTEIKHILHL
ncbi:uncharacterized protein LOC121367538 [Gigantopelta aegis]|uniref:uncharacterized protein LOC121367538 n=1 Tax=Gigantopelta aegis TaxID=1735272 RepID=UPI001B88CB58|nr:uncharacterized protein LOC121367538 [Gigantopelta aegis]XP_041347718.1 uncharacterized protein LOC121367538 [Gigantopelta aegis]